MGSEDMAPPPSTPEDSRRKHRNSPEEDGAEEGSSKRRKHHHRHHSRHHHHRRHRDRSGHGREKEDGGEGVPPAAPEKSSAEGLPKPPPDLDDEREEGEILDDEDGVYDIEGQGGDLPSGGSGGGVSLEFEADVMPDDHLVMPKEDLPEFDDDRGEGAFLGQKNPRTNERIHESCNGKDATLIDDKEGLMDSLSEDGNLVANDQEHGIGTESKATEPKSKRSQSRTPPKGTEKEKSDRDIKAKKLKRQTRSRSPMSGESLLSTKENKRDDHRSIVLDPNLERHSSRRRSESRGSHRDGTRDRNRSLSQEGLRDKFKAVGLSPSYNRYRDEDYRMERSGSRDRVRERSQERAPKSMADHTLRANSSELREKVRTDSDRERGGRHERLDHHDTRSHTRDAETEKLVRREREQSRSYSRQDGQEDIYGSGAREREKGRDRDRDRERVKSSDASRERERDREKVMARDMGRERERDKDSGRDRDRDRDMRRDRDRDHAKQIDKDRARSRDRHGDSRHPRYDELEHHRDRTRSRVSEKELSSTRHVHKTSKEERLREEDEEDYQERIEQQLAKQEEEDPEKIIEESRKRRLAILEKYKQQKQQQLMEPFSDDHDKGSEENAPMSEDIKPPVNADNGALPEVTENRLDTSDVYVADQSFSVGKSPQQNGTSAAERTTGAGGLGDGTPKSERSADMFCDDIFVESPASTRKMGKGDNLKVDKSGIHDNWDDAEGYYSYRFGEVLDGRYEVIASHGKGVFSTVVRAKDLKAGKGDPEEVAIKIIRNNETMYKAGLEELIILKKLVGADPEDKRHCVRFLSSFKYRNHLCLVFESLHMNLREVLKKFGRNIGLKLTAVRAYAKQLFIALKHLRNCGVLHCDIKPDNMLVNEAKNVLKLCDFGNAMFAGKNEITPYLVSRFYRAPEIILGLTYDHPMDIWSVGCCLYELYSGKVLFPGPSNNDMLRLHMELKGPFPKKMLRKGAFTDQHFDQDLNFHAVEEDPVTKKTVRRMLLNIKPKDIGVLITSSPGEDPKMVAHFKDLLERIFVLDPEKRMTVSQALSHPFITGK